MTVAAVLYLLTAAAISHPPPINRASILSTAQQLLHKNGAALATRSPRQAASTSTFARFLRDPSPGVCASASPPSSIGDIDPRIYGADPTGTKDSSAAFDLAVAALLMRNTSGHEAGGGNVDLGGSRINLGGGDYLLSKPIVIPHGYGHFGIFGGALRAASGFPKGRYLLEISDLSLDECKLIDPNQKACNEDVDVVDILFDCTRIADGALLINATMGGNVGPDIYAVNFLTAGISIHGGHEVMIHEAWLGATYYHTPNHTQSEAGSTAIQIFGNDHIVSDVIVFGGQIAVHVIGGANLIEGVHTWNDGTHAQSPGYGIVIENSQSVRCLGVYLDFTALRIEGAHHISVADSFFLGGGVLVIAPRTGGSTAKPAVDGLMVMDNTWTNANMPGNDTIVIDERSGLFTDPPRDLVMNGNIGTSRNVSPATGVAGTTGDEGVSHTMTARAVTVTQTLTLTKPSTRWNFNFTDMLLFPNVPIDKVVSYAWSYHTSGEPEVWVNHAVLQPVGHTVAVATDKPTTGTATVTVTQGWFTPGNH